MSILNQTIAEKIMQTFEYPMFTPHPKAKLYKRLTNDISTERENGEIIIVQENRYALVGKFCWIEDTAKQDVVEQPLDGLIVPNSYVTIKTNSLIKFEDGDIVELPKSSRLAGLWIITDGQTTDYIYTPKQVQTYRHLPLSSVGLR